MKRALAVSFVVLPLALVASAAPEASAQTNGYAVNRFEPSETGSDWFANESLDLRGNGRFAFGVLNDYTTNQIVYRNYDGSTQSALVGKQEFLHLGGSLVLANRLRIGVSVPLALYQNGQTSTYGTTTLTPPSKAAIGDIRVGADVRLLGEYRDPITVAIGVQVHLPTGFEDQLTGTCSSGRSSLAPRSLRRRSITSSRRGKRSSARTSSRATGTSTSAPAAASVTFTARLRSGSSPGSSGPLPSRRSRRTATATASSTRTTPARTPPASPRTTRRRTAAPRSPSPSIATATASSTQTTPAPTPRA
jgi:hypothetical protein